MKKKTLLTLFIFSSLFFIPFHSYSQVLTQKIKGFVVDKSSGEFLPGALIRVDQDQNGTITDDNGAFLLALPVGYHTLEVSFLGYGTKVYDEVLLTASKTTTIKVTLERSAISLADAEISGSILPISLSARTISMEQTQRYAATFYDPVRLSTSLPAVSSTNDQNNNVSVRGTSPAWNQWRLEGLEIASPNHLTNAGSFSDRPTQNGGGVNILSAQLLTDSRVLYGGYNASRGNALGAIFEMNFRDGDEEKKYHTAQASLLGFDLSTEGPFSENGKSSYLVNYRYSFTGLLAGLGVDFGGEEIKFQDVSFNLSFPYTNGELKIFGLGGISTNDFTGVTDPLEAEEEKDYSDIKYDGKMLAVGFSNTHRLSNRVSLDNGLIYSFNHSHRNEQRNFNSSGPVDIINSETYNEDRLSFKTHLNAKVGKAANLSVGYNAVNYQYKLRYFRDNRDVANFADRTESPPGEWLLQPFLQYDGFVGKSIKLEGGVNFSSYQLSNELIVEPRLMVQKYLGRGGSSLYGRAGVYSQIQSYITRLSDIVDFFPPFESSNRKLGLNKARKYQIGYLTTIGGITLNSELFFDQYFDIPAFISGRGGDPFTFVSVFNLSSETVRDQFDSRRKARVSGIDVSLEKKMLNQWYYLLGATYYNSTFEISDGEWLNSRWDGAYALNATLGKEIQLKRKNEKQRSLSLNGRVIYQGGFRRTPLDIDASNANGANVVAFETGPFGEKNPNYFRLDLRLSWRVQKNNYSRTLSLDFQNATNYQNFASENFDAVTGQVENKYQLGIIPLLTYRVEF